MSGASLESIDKALRHHAQTCPNKPTAILMSPFEAERIGWDEYKGIPIVGEPSLGTGRLRIECEGGPLEGVKEKARHATLVPA